MLCCALLCVATLVQALTRPAPRLRPPPTSHQTPRPLSIQIHVVAESLELLHADATRAPATHIRFGSLYFGQKKVVRVLLVNNSPSVATFGIALALAQANANASASAPNPLAAAKTPMAGDMTHHSITDEEDVSGRWRTQGVCGAGDGLECRAMNWDGMCCDVLCCAVLCCAVLCCAVLCCAVL